MRWDRRCLAIMLLHVSAEAAMGQVRLAADGGELVLTALAHASVQVEHAGVVVQVDPWSGAELATAKPASLVLVTDADDGAHHLDPKAIAALRAPGARVVIPATGRAQVPDGAILGNGETKTFDGLRVEAIAAYDLTPGEPYHPKGEANGYVLTVGGKRIFFAGVTECVPEIRALRRIDVAFLPMNLPQGRMAPAAVAECARAFGPTMVIPYHYDQGYLARKAGRPSPITAADMAASVKTLTDLLTDARIAVRPLRFYPGPAGH